MEARYLFHDHFAKVEHDFLQIWNALEGKNHQNDFDLRNPACFARRKAQESLIYQIIAQIQAA